MKRIEYIFYKDWKYKIISLFIAVILWAIVNLGNRTDITIEREVKVINMKGDYSYVVRPSKVKIKLNLIERLNKASVISEIRAFVDARKIKEGNKRAEVEVYVPFSPFIRVDSVDPPFVEINFSRRTNYRIRMNQ